MTDKVPLDKNMSCSNCYHKKICHFTNNATEDALKSIVPIWGNLKGLMLATIESHDLPTWISIVIANFCTEYKDKSRVKHYLDLGIATGQKYNAPC